MYTVVKLFANHFSLTIYIIIQKRRSEGVSWCDRATNNSVKYAYDTNFIIYTAVADDNSERID